jgi:ABC-type phosphate/phosphonate transport system ATPase subunit
MLALFIFQILNLISNFQTPENVYYNPIAKWSDVQKSFFLPRQNAENEHQQTHTKQVR